MASHHKAPPVSRLKVAGDEMGIEKIISERLVEYEARIKRGDVSAYLLAERSDELRIIMALIAASVPVVLSERKEG